MLIQHSFIADRKWLESKPVYVIFDRINMDLQEINFDNIPFSIGVWWKER